MAAKELSDGMQMVACGHNNHGIRPVVQAGRGLISKLSAILF